MLKLSLILTFLLCRDIKATLGAGAVVMGAPELGTGMFALSSALTTSGVLGKDF